MKVLIIEDEQATAQRLSKLLQEIEPDIGDNRSFGQY